MDESPWACAERSRLVEYEDPGMPYDLDHMIWPEFLAPLPIRERVEQVRADNVAILQDDLPRSEIGKLQDVY